MLYLVDWSHKGHISFASDQNGRGKPTAFGNHQRLLPRCLDRRQLPDTNSGHIAILSYPAGPTFLGSALLTLSWDKNWDSNSLVNGYPSFYPRIALVAPSPDHIDDDVMTRLAVQNFDGYLVLTWITLNKQPSGRWNELMWRNLDEFVSCILCHCQNDTNVYYIHI